MSYFFRSEQAPARSSGGPAPDQDGADFGSNAERASSLRSEAPAAEADKAPSSRFKFGLGEGPDFLNPVVPVSWLMAPGFEDMRRQAASEAPMEGTPGAVLHQRTSVGSSGYAQTQVNGPGVKKTDDSVEANLFQAQGHLRTAGSETHAAVKGPSLTATTGDKYGFTAGTGSANVRYNGQHTRAELEANGPSTALEWGDKGPAVKLATGSASASGAVTASGTRWSGTAGGRIAAEGPSASVDAVDGLQMSGPSTTVEGGIGLSRLRDAADPTSGEQVVSLTRARGEAPSLNVNSDAVLHIIEDNPEIAASAARGMRDFVTGELGLSEEEAFGTRSEGSNAAQEVFTPADLPDFSSDSPTSGATVEECVEEHREEPAKDAQDEAIAAVNHYFPND